MNKDQIDYDYTTPKMIKELFESFAAVGLDFNGHTHTPKAETIEQVRTMYKAEISKLNKAIERKNRGIKNLRNTIRTMERLGFKQTKDYNTNE